MILPLIFIETNTLELYIYLKINYKEFAFAMRNENIFVVVVKNFISTLEPFSFFFCGNYKNYMLRLNEFKKYIVMYNDFIPRSLDELSEYLF